MCRFLRSASADAVHHSIFRLCTAVYFGRRNCSIPPDASVLKRHPFPSSSGMSSYYVELGPPGRAWIFPFIREYVSYFYCDVHYSSRASWSAAVSGHCGNSLASVRGTQLKESSLLVVHILDHDGSDVIVAPTRHQVWYRGQFFKHSKNLIPATVAYSFR